ncbi:MAG: C40 family peptidase [Lachnospiraceae bacterium]|nr:C40 family peptidase [Lachnospiraceae bacterium]
MKFRFNFLPKTALLCSVVLMAFPMGVKAENKMADAVSPAGVGSLLDTVMTEEEYLAAAEDTSLTFGYNNLGVSDVENHLNVREAPSTDAKLVGKMTNNCGCEIMESEGEWYHVVSGEVEGWVHSDYLLTGAKAILRANEVVTKMARATEGGLRVRSEANTDCEIITTMGEGERLEVIEELDGWIKVSLDDEEAYISADYAIVEEELDTAITMTELLYGEGVSDVRVEICQYAKEFLGNRYVWGGSSLTKGTDCSGFTMSVYKKYGISLPHSSVAQSKMGTKVSLSEAKAGDLVFYAKGGTVNHVGIYIGNGQVIHASNPKQGIKISPVGYRTIHSIRQYIYD